MKLKHILLFLLAGIFNYVLAGYICFTEIYSDITPLLGNTIAIVPNFHFGMWHSYLLSLTQNGLLTNQVVLAFSIALCVMTLLLLLRAWWLKNMSTAMILIGVSVALGVGAYISQFQGYDYLSNYRASFWYSVGSLGFFLALSLNLKKYNTLVLMISGLSLGNLVSHMLIPNRHIGIFHFDFLPHFGSMNLADIFVLIFVVGAIVAGLYQLIRFLNAKPIASILALGLLASCDTSVDIETVEQTLEHRPVKQTPDYNVNKNAYFGDLHLHTAFSFDAYIRGQSYLFPDDAYRFAKGDTIRMNTGEAVFLKKPLDFLAVTDHSEYLGVLSLLPKQELIAILSRKPWIRYSEKQKTDNPFLKVGRSIVEGTPNKGLYRQDSMRTAWSRVIEAANQHYQPGIFTTFVGYEWTSIYMILPKYRGARNMHRNVIFGNEVLPNLPFSSLDSNDPEALWIWMEMQRKKGSKVIAIPHNANISDGLMYRNTNLRGYPINKQYAQTRMRNEPINEVVQRKGQAMAHPQLSPEDEFADFSMFHQIFGDDTSYTPTRYKGSYAREALKDGLAIENKIGVNPFQFGLIGSTDLHNGLSNTNENETYGDTKAATARSKTRLEAWKLRVRNPGGLAGVWAEENTRASIFNSMERKEVFATSGTRIKVRFFGGWSFTQADLEKDWVTLGYQKGVAMGNTLPPAIADFSPSFIIWATKDPDAAHLDRIQVVKGWTDADNQTHEKIYNVAWANKATRPMDAKGDIPAIINTVNVKKATYTNQYGQVELKTVWTDPDFDKTQNAVYYLRVLEIPTPSGTTYDASRLGVAPPADMPVSIQERAWSSPIWYQQ